MNREIKFRAWDIDLKIMRNIELISFPLNKPSGKDISATDLDDNDISEWIYDYKLMQYTGLKDINGVEIYEGDIVKYDTYCDGLNEEGVISQVKYVDGGFIPFTEDYGDSSGVLYDIYANNYEIIGNIYETPELLEEER